MSEVIVYVLIAISSGYGNYGTLTKVEEFPTRESCRAFVKEIKQVRFATAHTEFICVKKYTLERNDD